MGIIYKATNKVNKKSYVGQTKGSLEGRMRGHFHDSYRSNIYFGNSLKKYGVENFSWTILYECKDCYLDFMEEFFIRVFDTFNKGYNLTTGGEGGYIRSKRTKDLMSEAAKKRTGLKNSFYGKHHSKKAKDLISKVHKGKLPWNKGKTGIYSEETLKKMSDCKKGKKLTAEHKQKIKDNWSGFKGYKHSEKTKEYLKEINLGRKLSKDVRYKMSELRKGKKHSDKTKRKMSEKRKLYWKNKKRGEK